NFRVYHVWVVRAASLRACRLPASYPSRSSEDGMKRLFVYVVALVVCLFASRAYAQNTQLSSRVIDQSGGTVARASVLVQGEGTGVSQSADTNDQSMYYVPFLQPGAYKVSVQMSDFRTIMRGSVTLDVNQKTKLDFTLETTE